MPKNARRTSPEFAKNWKSPGETDSSLFVHSALDKYGLNLYEFRILAHVAALESKTRGCDVAQAKMAKVCGMSQRMVLEVLRILCSAGLIQKQKVKGNCTNTYRLNPPSKWKHPSELEKIRNQRAAKAKAAEQESDVETEDFDKDGF